MKLQISIKHLSYALLEVITNDIVIEPVKDLSVGQSMLKT